VGPSFDQPAQFIGSLKRRSISVFLDEGESNHCELAPGRVLQGLPTKYDRIKTGNNQSTKHEGLQMRNKLLATAAILALAGAAPVHATTITFCGPQTEGGTCEGANEQKVFLTEGHTESSGSGTVGQNGPTLLFSVDSGLLDPHVDTGGGFANITSANADDKAFPGLDFNGIDITVPGFTFTDIAFDVQLAPTEASGTDSFTAQGFSFIHVSDGINTEFDAPETDKQFSLTANGGSFDEVNLFSTDGFKEIKHIEISGLAAVATPEASTWAMLLTGFGLMGLATWCRGHSKNGARSIFS
jgi:hypothetical protein